MSMDMNLNDSIANADALVAETQVAFGATEMPCTYCGKPITGDELAELQAAMEDGEILVAGSADAMCDACASDDSANGAANAADVEAAAAAEKAAAMAAEIAKLKAENAALAKAKETPKPLTGKAAKIAAAKAAAAAAAAKAAAAKTPLLPTDMAPGVIDPKHLTDRDKALLELLTQERTPVDKLKDKTNVPGTYAVAVHGWLKQRKYSEEWIRAMIADALARNVISKMFIPTRSGKDMVLYFNAQWRPNVKREFEFAPVSAGEIAAAHAKFGK